MAHITQENNLIETYNNKKDLYATIGSAMFHKDYWECMEHWEDGSSNPEGKVIRKKCKQIVLGILYGMGANLLSNNLGVSIEECKEMLDNFFKMFPSIKEFTLKNEEDAKSVGYVEDYMGRRRHLPDASLPQISVSVKKDVYTNVDCFVDCDINDVKISIEDYERAKQLQKEWEELEESKLRISLFEKKKNFKEEYSGDSSVVIKDNGNFISRALTQCTNARIQGCLDGNVRVQSKELGFVKLKDCCNKTLTLWDGDDWTSGLILYSGMKQKCTIEFSDGSNIVCSPEHKFLVVSIEGKYSFKKCKEIRKNDRVIINQRYHASESKYSSNDFKLDKKPVYNYKECYLEDLTNVSSFGAGRFIGRVASDGSLFLREQGGSCVSNFIAEHEFDIIPLMEKYASPFGIKAVVGDVRKGRNQKIAQMNFYSKSFVKELDCLDIKHKISENIFSDTELLRGFISGFFDGDGGISGNNIILTFGTQYDFEPMIKDLQKALFFYGIRSRYRKYKNCYKLCIRKSDSKYFSSIIGFMNGEKQKKASEMYAEKFGKCFDGKKTIIVKSVNISDDYIPMYDVCNTDRGYFVADGIITHNSAASLTKKAMVNIFNDERMKNLGFRILVPVHDELLGECPMENAEEVEKLLSELMIGSAKPECTVSMKVDTYVVKHWYADEVSDKIKKMYNEKISDGVKEEDAIFSISEEFPEISYDVLENMCHGDYDCFEEKI